MPPFSPTDLEKDIRNNLDSGGSEGLSIACIAVLVLVADSGQPFLSVVWDSQPWAQGVALFQIAKKQCFTQVV